MEVLLGQQQKPVAVLVVLHILVVEVVAAGEL
jgi:hypothetical protein